jgi:hypothetical protein
MTLLGKQVKHRKTELSSRSRRGFYGFADFFDKKYSI